MQRKHYNLFFCIFFSVLVSNFCDFNCHIFFKKNNSIPFLGHINFKLSIVQKSGMVCFSLYIENNHRYLQSIKKYQVLQFFPIFDL